MKKILTLTLLASLTLVLAACNDKPSVGPLGMPDYKNELTGYIVKFENGDVMLINENEAIILTGDFDFLGLDNGDEIKIYYDELEETFPLRTIVKEMVLKSKGNMSKINEETLEKLKSLGWNLKD